MFNSKRQNLILNIFVGLMILHWAEHLVQAYQIYVLGYPRHHAMGLLGQIFPWLMHSEWLHFGYAFLTLVGVLLLWSAFTGAARKWWNAAILISIWHLLEHTLLFAQAQGGFFLWGAKEPTSILQLFLPRVELHLFYNTLVTIPIVVAMVICWKKKKASPETVQVAAA